VVNGKKVRVRVAEPIGVDERVAEVLAERARKAMNGL